MNLDIRLIVQEAQLPATVNALTGLEDGQPDVYIMLVNDKLGEEEKATAFIHEMLHIWHGDFTSSLPVATLEALRKEETTRIAGTMAKNNATSVNNH